ncbi:MAG: formylglycine-generating enzyme family protein [Planctomycetota bacterium]|nr:formylglycine-generating enzyme family protein [Planctomycetota bacterium]
MTIPLRLPLLAVVWLASSAFAAETPAPAWPLWDGHETIEQYAKRANLPPTKTLDLGGGVNLKLVLIPAGKFIMGTPEPEAVDEVGLRKKIVVGQAAFAVGVGVLLVLIATVIIRAIRQRHRPQYSLARFMVMIVAAGVAVLGGMHSWHSGQARAQAWADYKAAFAGYQRSFGDEKPAHQVTLTTPFYMGKHEVTQEQYAQVMGANPSQGKGPSLPVEMVSWDEAQESCKKVNLILSRDREGAVTAPLADARGSDGTVRLPTEAEWEFACRAGTTTTYYTGDAEGDLGRAAWYSVNSSFKTHPVGQKEPNAFGLYDMHGNVWEWCQDDWQEQYKPEAAVDPQGPAQGDGRVLRGGSWFHFPARCRSAARNRRSPDYRDDDIGFRVVVLATRAP